MKRINNRTVDYSVSNKIFVEDYIAYIYHENSDNLYLKLTFSDRVPPNEITKLKSQKVSLRNTSIQNGFAYPYTNKPEFEVVKNQSLGLHCYDCNPSYVEYNKHGYVISEIWIEGFIFHRERGPAIIDYNCTTHDIDIAYWWLDGVRMEHNEMGKFFKNSAYPEEDEIAHFLLMTRN